ncbi:DinB family protein [Reichenbachiella carrageenanivorans]|uniref:DinB family protein n=1 Tax=Reichenbachiella carrageenanivorans TaxID=2979869 RepID=A0ABY6D3J7_9BACT|nr:DinB family protein [Reichenbachiella carrageenanivorans]UXX79683.1 DinB family protein [Reichenbachiella carrageenanivorans]
MITRTKWFDRTFEPIADNSLLFDIIERLEGTGLRIEHKLHNSGSAYFQSSTKHKWSIKKQIGHLGDVEPLWLERIKQIKAGETSLKAADPTNRKTDEAAHDNKKVKDLISEFSRLRSKLIAELRVSTADQLNHAATHPRTGHQMKLVDLAYFVAEHDDHHLATIHDMLIGD